MAQKQVEAGNAGSERGLNPDYAATRDAWRVMMIGHLDTTGTSITVTMYGKTLTLDKDNVKGNGDEAHAFNIISNIAAGLSPENYAKFLKYLEDPNSTKMIIENPNGSGYMGVGTMTVNFTKWGQKYGEANGVTQVSDSKDDFSTNLADKMISNPQYRNQWKVIFEGRGIDVSDDTKLDAAIRSAVELVLNDPSKYDVEAHAAAYAGGHAEMGGISKEFFSIASEDFKRNNPIVVGSVVSIQGQWENKGTTGTTDGGTTWANESFDVEFAVPGETGTHTLSVGRATIGSKTASKYTVSIDGKKVGMVDKATLQAWGLTLDENRNLAVGNLDGGDELWGPKILTDVTKQRILENSYSAFGLTSPTNAQPPEKSRQMLQDILAEYYATWALTGEGQHTI